MTKNILLALVVIGLLQNVSADCTGTLSIAEINPNKLYDGDYLSLVVYTTVPGSLGIRNMDIIIKDPQENKVYIEELRFDDDTYTVELNTTIDSSYIDGIYTIVTKIEVLNKDNLNEIVCTEEVVRTFEVETGRTTYNDLMITFELLPEYQRWTYNESRNISFGDAKLPINLYIDNLPFETNIIMNDFNLSEGENSTINITADIPFYSFEQMMVFKRIINTQEYTIKHLAENTTKKFEDIIKNSTGTCTESVIKIWDKVENCENEKINFQERISFFQNETMHLNNEINKLNNKKEEINLNSINFIVGFVAGAVILYLFLRWIAKTKIEESKD